MGERANLRAARAAARQLERAEKQRHRELLRLAKERARLSELEQARLEVEEHAAALEALLTLHRECGSQWDWIAVASKLVPAAPSSWSPNRHDFEWRSLGGSASVNREAAALADAAHHQALGDAHTRALADWQELHGLAQRIVDRDPDAYLEALENLAAPEELESLGCMARFQVIRTNLVSCALSVRDSGVVPAESKSLTASGKLTVKAISRARSHEIYQDYVCSAMLRVAREAMAVLPVEWVIVTAEVNSVDSARGHAEKVPVLSVAIDRKQLMQLNFEHIDPSDALESFPHAGEFKRSRRSDSFTPIVPISPDSVALSCASSPSPHDAFESARRLEEELTRLVEAII